MAIEDFTIYSETEEVGNYLTVVANKVTVANMPQSAWSYVTKDAGAGHFGNFEHDLTINASSFATYGIIAYWIVGNEVKTTLSDLNDNHDGFALFLDGEYPRLELQDYTDHSYDSMAVNSSFTYYVTLDRTSTTLNCKVYSDASRTTLVDTLTTACPVNTWRYIGGGSAGWGSTPVASGYWSDLDLNEAVEGWTNIAKVSGITAADIAKVNGIAVASIAKFKGIAV